LAAVDVYHHVSILLLLLYSIMMNNIEDWLAQVHGILQGNADCFKSSLVFGNAIPEQSTKAIVKLESAVELLLTSASSPAEVRPACPTLYPIWHSVESHRRQ
jgi:hypothetical protein